VLKKVKEINKERVKKGKEPVYLKDRQLKELGYREKFEELERKGKLEEFIEKKEIETDKRARGKRQ